MGSGHGQKCNGLLVCTSNKNGNPRGAILMGDTLVPTQQRAGAAVSSIRQPPLHVDLTCLDGTAGL